MNLARNAPTKTEMSLENLLTNQNKHDIINSESEKRKEKEKMKEIEKQFAGVCSTYGTGLEHLKRTIAVYEALKKEKEPVRPIELGKHMGLYSYSQVIHPLYWLEAIGLVRREEHEETIKIWGGYFGGHFETVTVTIDGLTYSANKWVENEEYVEKVVKYYKWVVV